MRKAVKKVNRPVLSELQRIRTPGEGSKDSEPERQRYGRFGR
jgi:hypothetical protein